MKPPKPLDQRMREACYARARAIGLTKPEISELSHNVIGRSVATADIPELRVMLATLNGFVVISELLALRPSTQAVLEWQRERLMGEHL